MTYYTVTSRWVDEMTVTSRPMTLVRAEAEFAELSGYHSVTHVQPPQPFTGKLSRRDAILIEEDEAR